MRDRVRLHLHPTLLYTQQFMIKRPIYNSCTYNNRRVVVFPALPILACRGMCQRRVWMARLKPPACSRLLVMVVSRLRMPLRVSSLPLRQPLMFEHPHGLVRGSVVGNNRQHEPLTVVPHVTALHCTFRLEPATNDIVVKQSQETFLIFGSNPHTAKLT